MSFKIGLIGKPNAGKSTLFSAITATEVEIASYPFTTVAPNIGTSFIIRECPEVLIGKKCNPNHGSCSNGKRFIPVQIVDVPGLIEGASEGKGMGNQFLQSVTDASALMLIFDLSEALKAQDG
ncbi:translation-associated GTPase, partial [mine drainage metagenome]